MKAKIDRAGWLQVERAGVMKTQYCPYSSTEGEGLQPCGDWCPKFEESISGPHPSDPHFPFVTICGGPSYEIVADKRNRGDAPKEGE